MKPFITINELIRNITENERNPDWWQRFRPRIEREHETLNQEETDTFNRSLIDSHLLSISRDPYNKWQTRCILYAKLRHIAAGGTAISPDVFDRLVEMFSQDETDLLIPKNQSYSCGDVVPGAYLAKNLMDHGYDLTGKDAISLINGSYITLGAAISLLPKLTMTLDRLADNLVDLFTKTGLDASVIRIDCGDNSVAFKLYEAIMASDQRPSMTRQSSVSIRASMQTLNQLHHSITELYETINQDLSRPSDNPLIIGTDILSNSSFMSPKLGGRLSAVIEAVLYTAWNIDRRLHYVLSGEVPGIPVNGTTEAPGLIQVPKMTTHILSRMRTQQGTRPSVTGLSTSYGIEDIWTSGGILVEQLDRALDDLLQMIHIEHTVLTNLDAPEKVVRQIQPTGHVETAPVYMLRWTGAM